MFMCHKIFKTGKEYVDYKQYSERPSSFQTFNNVPKIKILLNSGCRVCLSNDWGRCWEFQNRFSSNRHRRISNAENL